MYEWPGGFIRSSTVVDDTEVPAMRLVTYVSVDDSRPIQSITKLCRESLKVEKALTGAGAGGPRAGAHLDRDRWSARNDEAGGVAPFRPQPPRQTVRGERSDVRSSWHPATPEPRMT